MGLGGVLSQIRAGEEHPIIYISRKLANERNYFLGREFTLVTDHVPLK